MSAAKNLIFAILFSQLCFSVWTQQLNISAIDLTGKPIENAQVSITYQMASQVSETDGLLTGQTNQYGYFYGTITNRVQAAFASSSIQVRISTSYWPGEMRKLQVNESSVLHPQFVVPVQLQTVYVKALSNRMEIVPGAQVVISGKSPFTKATGKDGMARFFLPPDSNFSGFVSFSNVSRSFSSGDIVQSEGKNVISVVLPPLEGEVAGSVAGKGESALALRFLAINGTPLSDHQVGFSTKNDSYVLFTDQDGVAEFLSNGTGLLNVTVREYEFNYIYPMNLSGGNRSKTITLGRLLNVSFYQLQEGANCFKLYANVTDPRPLQLRAFMFEYLQPKVATQLTVNDMTSGLYYSRICITANTPVRVSVANKYEVMDAFMNLTFTRPLSPAAPKPLNQSKTSASAPKQSGDDMAVVAIVIGVTCLLSAFFARAYLSRSSRFMIEYLRHLNGEIQKRRHKKPAVPPVVQPPQGQQPPEEPPPQPPAA